MRKKTTVAEDTGENATEWQLPADVIAAIRAGDEDAAAVALGREGLGGRIVARLFINIAAAHARYSPIAAGLAAAVSELTTATNAKDALARFAPQSIDDAIQAGEQIEATTTRWARAINAQAECQQAGAYAAFCTQYVPSLFGCPPPPPGGKILGTVPPEVVPWFEEHGADPRVFGSWREIGREREPRRRTKLVAQDAPVNRRRSS